MGYNNVIAPTGITGNDGGGNITTSGTTESPIISRTITNPYAAGQILIWARLSYANPSVVTDTFEFKIRFGTGTAITATVRATGQIRAQHTNDNGEVTLQATCPVSDSGAQIVSMTAQRSGGTGTLLLVNGRCQIGWLIIPGASVVA